MSTNEKNNIRFFDVGMITRNTNDPSNLKVAADLHFLDLIAKEHLGMPIDSRYHLELERYGGDHQHKHAELLVALGGHAIFLHRNLEGDIIRTPMGPNEDGGLRAIYVPPLVPHCVINAAFENAEAQNNGSIRPVILHELRSAPVSSEGFVSFVGTPSTLLPPSMR